MAKVKEETHIPFKDKDGNENKIYVLWNVDDEEGYGIDIQDCNAGIESFSFGHGEEAYRFSYRVFMWISDNLKRDLKFCDDVLNPLICWYPDEMRDLDIIKEWVEEWEVMDPYLETLKDLHEKGNHDAMADLMLKVQSTLIEKGYLTKDLLPHDENNKNRNFFAVRDVFFKVRGEFQEDTEPCGDFSYLSAAFDWLELESVAE